MEQINSHSGQKAIAGITGKTIGCIIDYQFAIEFSDVSIAATVLYSFMFIHSFIPQMIYKSYHNFEF